MARKTTKTTRLTALVVGAFAMTVPFAAQAQADPSDDAFIDSLGSAGLGATDPADAAGMSLGPATMFTGLAISAFCPGAVASLGNGESPIPFGLFGF